MVRSVIQVLVCMLLAGGLHAADRSPIVAHYLAGAVAEIEQETGWTIEQEIHYSEKTNQREEQAFHSRSRGVFFFTAANIAHSDRSGSFPHCVIKEPLYVDNNTLILPFYYIFLFRLTLF